ncbi:hypothetical protein EDB19DRAFT_1777212 [Suillus lakei]|nr:hypothetical protein EDB19DRAFT_1777212 [Suillus lakei]
MHVQSFNSSSSSSFPSFLDMALSDFTIPHVAFYRTSPYAIPVYEMSIHDTTNVTIPILIVTILAAAFPSLRMVKRRNSWFVSSGKDGLFANGRTILPPLESLIGIYNVLANFISDCNIIKDMYIRLWSFCNVDMPTLTICLRWFHLALMALMNRNSNVIFEFVSRFYPRDIMCGSAMPSTRTTCATRSTTIWHVMILIG